jgi:hypothetical protein
MISRGYRWLDENIEHDETDQIRAEALAKKWSELKTAEENERFARQSDIEDGYDCYEVAPCEECERCLEGDTGQCVDIKNWEKQQTMRSMEFDLEVEIIETKLELIGARIARAYEHWNEDERLMEYLENRSEEC